MPLPGHLELHAPLVALTPALLALATVPAVLALGARPGQRVIGWIGIGAALVLAALFLIPGRVVGAYEQPLLGGVIRLGLAQLLCAPICGAWIAAAFRPRDDNRPGAAPGWCARTALALALPLVAAPVLPLFIEGDQRRAPATRRDHARAALIVAAALAAAVGAPLWAAHAVACLAAAALGRGHWRFAAALAGVAALCPPY
ncbi:MAG TPA: hypothetical protein VEL07_07005 [Planctomycetota bacterium]|nr:hypothetical protein [Planctomycetota bacterium]